MSDVDHCLPTTGYGQYSTTTCWFASYRMLHAWKRADEQQIRLKLKDIGLDVDQLFKRGLYADEFIKAGAALGMVGWRGSYFRDLDTGQFVHILQTYGPLWVGIDNESGQSGHAVVIGGYVSNRDVFKIFNPYNRFEPGTVDIDWATPRSSRRRSMILGTPYKRGSEWHVRLHP